MNRKKLLMMGKAGPLIFGLMATFYLSVAQIFLPSNAKDRHAIDELKLTAIGKFGLMRKARRDVPAHLHTGIDIQRPTSNYNAEPVYPIATGIVISKRDDGPYANLIVEHSLSDGVVWSTYEHISGINVKVGDKVNPNRPIARFMNKDELDRYGWQFDHFHLEVLKVKPMHVKPSTKTPTRFYTSYTLMCFSAEELEHYFYNPIAFLRQHVKQK